MRRTVLILVTCITLAAPAAAAIRVHPDGVNVNTQGATTVFLTFGGLRDQVPAEAFWCGELVPASPDLGLKCDPSTIFGQLPVRFDQSRRSGAGGFTDIMSIPPSVARRAYQAAEQGARSSFFYVRRFVSTTGAPDEYVAVTCRLAGGGARVPLALLDVRLAFETERPVQFVAAGAAPPAFRADITYNGTGRLKGRWEVVLPGEELPTPQDLLTEATLPVEERGTQRRYTEVARFNVFLPPTGRVTLPGPDVSRLPTAADGAYLVLLRVETSADREGDSNLASVGAGPAVAHSGAVAGFPLPVLRYIVGGEGAPAAVTGGALEQVLPRDRATVAADTPIDFSWIEVPQAAVYRVEFTAGGGQPVFSALVAAGTGIYRAPLWLRDRLGDGRLRWRVVALDLEGKQIRASGWRDAQIAAAAGSGGRN